MGITSFLYGLIRFQSVFKGLDLETENFHREEFEAHIYKNVRPLPSLKRELDGSYADESVQASWLNWLDAANQMDSMI